jgi:hypothetical protein
MNSDDEYIMEYTVTTKIRPSESVFLCHECCKDLVIIGLQTDRFTFQNLKDFANRQLEKLYAPN